MKTTNNILMKTSQYIKTFTGIGLITVIIGLFGAVFLYASTASTGPNGENKDGKFYEYFQGITTNPDISISNPYFTEFGTGFKSEYSDGDAFVKSYLATLGGSSTDIVTGFDGSGEIQRTSIDVFMKKWLGSFGPNTSPNSAIIGFSNTTGYPIYSREVGYWSGISGGISYIGGVQIGESAVPGSLEVINGNITVNNILPSNDDDLITKSYVDSYLRDTCVRFLGTWNASTSKCSKASGGGGGGATCTPGTWGACTGACGNNNGTQSRTDSCGTTTTQSCTASACTSSPTCDDGIRNQGETQIDCGGPNCGACSVTPPTCIPNGSCSAANPACEQTTTGVDNCGNSCEKTGGSCGGGTTTGAYTYGAWGTCTGACGTNNATQTRSESCNFDVCTNKQATEKACTASMCTTTGVYSYGEWGQCTGACGDGNGTQTRSESCNFDTCTNQQATERACTASMCSRSSCVVSKCVDFGSDIGQCGGGAPSILCECYRYQDVIVADGASIEVSDTNLFAGTISCKGYVWDYGWACERRYSTVICDNGNPIYN